MSPPAFSPSLNRVRLAALPGLPAGMAGGQAHEWLASWGVARLVRERLNLPGLPPVPDVPEAARLAAALAALLATLHLAPEDAREARPEWPAAHWDRWRAVRRVGVGGGMVRGALGERMIGAARDWLPRLGAEDMTVFRASSPHLLPLLGAAGSLPDGPAVLIDAGHTSVKRARVSVKAGHVVSLAEAPALPAPFGLTPPDLAAFLADAAAELVLCPGVPPRVGVSLAAYTDVDGQPHPQQLGLYGPLGTLPLVPTLEAHLESRLGLPRLGLPGLGLPGLGRPALVRVIHDGTAALRALAGQADAALVLGTSVGGELAPGGERGGLY